MKPTTIALLQKCKQEKQRFATITAYDYSFAKLFADEGINVMLVGDSLGMTVQGHDSTLPVTVEDIAYHTQAVRRGAPIACCSPTCRLWPMPPRNRPSLTPPS
jgi:3-methyl-2-oxobutanoate hydroxymethyltransferase